MELKVFWTNAALENLNSIFDYYKSKAGIKVAHGIVSSIADKVILLEHQSKMGQKEELLKSRSYEYRYIIDGNYKIIYWIEESCIKIASVFDCRQNPKKIKKLK